MGEQQVNLVLQRGSEWRRCVDLHSTTAQGNNTTDVSGLAGRGRTAEKQKYICYIIYHNKNASLFIIFCSNLDKQRVLCAYVKKACI